MLYYLALASLNKRENTLLKNYPFSADVWCEISEGLIWPVASQANEGWAGLGRAGWPGVQLMDFA